MSVEMSTNHRIGMLQIHFLFSCIGTVLCCLSVFCIMKIGLGSEGMLIFWDAFTGSLLLARCTRGQ